MEFFSKMLQAAESITFPETNSTVDVFLRTFSVQKQFFYFISKLARNTFPICVALKRTVFGLKCVLFLISEW